MSELFKLLNSGLEVTIRDDNPWWRGEKIYNLPTMKRWAFEPVLSNLKNGLTPAVVLKGPRRVGKSVLLEQVIEELLKTGIKPHRIFRVQFDDLPDLRKLDTPILDLCHWYAENILKKTFNQAANDGEQAYIFLDEVQNLSDWGPQLKHLVDINPVKVLVTGSSALRLEAGADSLAGRTFPIEMGPMLLREIADLRGFGKIPPLLPFNGSGPLKEKKVWQELRQFGIDNAALRHKAFSAFSERGSYPIAQADPSKPWPDVADYLNENIIRKVIKHDLRMGEKGRKRDEHLLEEVFRLACRYAGQSPGQSLYLTEIKRSMNANIGWTKILSYLKFLDGTLLVRLIEPMELRLKRRRNESKVCICDHTLRAAWLQETIHLAPESLDKFPHLADLAGHIAESTAGYFLKTINGLDVAHFPARTTEPEVDFVLTVGEQRIPVEIKYRKRIDHQDTVGLRSFMEKAHYNAPFGILVTLNEESGSDDPRIVSIPLSSLLLLR